MAISTESKIKLAIARIEKGKPKIVATDRKLSLASVSEEAGIHRTTIINRYPLLADVIRGKSGQKSKQHNPDKQKILDLEEKLASVKAENVSLKAQLAKAISLQATRVLSAEKKED